MIKVAPLNGDKVIQLLRGAALTRAMAESATLEWKTYDESTLINVLYSLGSIWGMEKPGYAEVSIKSRQQLLPRSDEILMQYLRNFADAMGQGPAQMHTCLERIERIRNIDREKLEAIARDAREINSEVAAELGEFVQQLAVVRAASTIALTLMGGGIALYSIGLGTGAAVGAAGYAAAAKGFAATAAIAGNIGLGYSITGAVVSSWYEVPACGAVAITAAGEFAKAKAMDLPGKLGEKLVEKAGQSREVNEKAVNFLNGAIRRRAQEVQMAASAQAQQQGEHTLARFHNANFAAHNRIGAAKLRAGAGAVLQGFMVVYLAASDIRSAMEEYDKTVASVR